MEPQTALAQPTAAARQGFVLLHLLGVEGFAELLDQLGGLDAGATGGIGLAVVVQLGEFGVVVEAGGCGSCLLQQHHAD